LTLSLNAAPGGELIAVRAVDESEKLGVEKVVAP
jgi:hypothetical protein